MKDDARPSYRPVSTQAAEDRTLFCLSFRASQNSNLILYFASTNPGKLAEFREAARPSGIEVQLVPGISDVPECVEDGLTFEENARKKALQYSPYAAGLVFADDSGLCVDALDGAPGVYSARFAGDGATDQENNQKLLAELGRAENFRDSQARANSAKRLAKFVCAIALAERGRVLTIVEGRVQGSILESPRGVSGFGYDPLFFYPPLGKTLAELGPAEKFKISHRGEAFRKLLEYLGLASDAK
jgi:XTP/dITP diphosphohydrolase